MIETIKTRSKKTSYTLNTASFFDPYTPRSLRWNSEEKIGIADMHGTVKYKSLSSRSTKVNRTLPLKIRSQFNSFGVVKNGRKSKRVI